MTHSIPIFPTVLLLAVLCGCVDAPGERGPLDPALFAASEVQGVDLERVLADRWMLAAFPDGRRAVIADVPMPDPVIIDLESGVETRIPLGAGWMEDRYPIGAAVSRDGTQVAVLMVNGGQSAVYIVGADGGELRTLHRFNGGRALLEDWSPDGSSLLLTVIDSTGAVRLTRLTTADQQLRTVHDFGWRAPLSPRYSADGRYIAYARQAQDGAPSRDLYLLDVGSGESRTIVDMTEAVNFAGWSPTGEFLYFSTGTASGSARLWRVAVQGGGPAGDPELVRSDIWGLRPIGVTSRGLFYSVSFREWQIHESPFDTESLRLTTEPRLLARLPDFPTGMVWSPDGAYLAYTLSNKGVTGEPNSLVVRDRHSGAERSFTPEIDLQVGWFKHWGLSGLSVPATERGESGWFQLDLTTGRFQRIASSTTGQLSADGGLETFARQSEGGGYELLVRRWPEGEERVIYRGSRRIGMPLSSPDGRHIAFTDGSDIAVVPVDGGAARTLHVVQAPDWIKGGSLAWTPDGQNVLFVASRGAADQQPRAVVGAVSLSGEVRHVLDRSTGEVIHFTLSPDGRNFAFTGVVEATADDSEVWVVRTP